VVSARNGLRLCRPGKERIGTTAVRDSSPNRLVLED
jgi:hypothetical protein